MRRLFENLKASVKVVRRGRNQEGALQELLAEIPLPSSRSASPPPHPPSRSPPHPPSTSWTSSSPSRSASPTPPPIPRKYSSPGEHTGLKFSLDLALRELRSYSRDPFGYTRALEPEIHERLRIVLEYLVRLQSVLLAHAPATRNDAQFAQAMKKACYWEVADLCQILLEQSHTIVPAATQTHHTDGIAMKRFINWKTRCNAGIPPNLQAAVDRYARWLFKQFCLDGLLYGLPDGNQAVPDKFDALQKDTLRVIHGYQQLLELYIYHHLLDYKRAQAPYLQKTSHFFFDAFRSVFGKAVSEERKAEHAIQNTIAMTCKRNNWQTLYL